jgi:hypothetical protein
MYFLEQLNECLNQMIDLCIRMNIQIEPSESGIKCSTCNEVIAVPQEEANDVGASKGKTETTQVQEEEVISKIQKFYKEKAYRKSVILSGPMY